MKLLISVCLGLFWVGSAGAVSTNQTSLSISVNPSEESIKAALGLLNKALNTQKEGTKSKYLASARKKIAPATSAVVFDGAVYVEGEKQFEEGVDTVFNFNKTCFKGSVADVAKLINAALKLGFWAGDEEQVKFASATSSGNVLLKIHDGPNGEDFPETIVACK